MRNISKQVYFGWSYAVEKTKHWSVAAGLGLWGKSSVNKNRHDQSV